MLSASGLKHYLSLRFATLQMCAVPSFASSFATLTTQAYSLGANGGSGGKAPQGPVPPGTTQRKLIYGKGGLEPPANYMSFRAA